MVKRVKTWRKERKRGLLYPIQAKKGEWVSGIRPPEALRIQCGGIMR